MFRKLLFGTAEMFKDDLIQTVESRHHELKCNKVSSLRRTSCKYSQGKNGIIT